MRERTENNEKIGTPTIFFFNIKGCFLEKAKKRVGVPIFYLLGKTSG